MSRNLFFRYNMLTGRYPFESDNDRNMLQLYEKISACQLVLPDDMNGELQDLLRGIHYYENIINFKECLLNARMIECLSLKCWLTHGP